MISKEREAFRQVALKLLDIRTFDDYNAFTKDDWLNEWLKETAHFTKRMLDAELDFVCPPEKEHQFTGRDVPIFEPPEKENDDQ